MKTRIHKTNGHLARRLVLFFQVRRVCYQRLQRLVWLYGLVVHVCSEAPGHQWPKFSLQKGHPVLLGGDGFDPAVNSDAMNEAMKEAWKVQAVVMKNVRQYVTAEDRGKQ
ncbi:hypothetical protein CGMCC3_g13374 [Colletotrichum fructicola]|nr:uncharacterized protein CGMCC3_g13374 [Colletotrichum fructicola]KAE9570529.1 hypothetical protein CGMCC3_g13374 [Colletotrichum fructicola]